MKRPCVECPWVVDNRWGFGFGGPDVVRQFMRWSLSGEHHPCHMAMEQGCEGSRRFAAQERGDKDQTVRIWDRDALIDAAYRLWREGRLPGQGGKRTYRGCH